MTDTNPRIAAVIPLYNGGRFIRDALESVLAQTLMPSEIIVVNDGSTDDGPAIVEAMAQQHPITLLHKENGGQSSARNHGIAHSTAEVIALLDQDDVWYANHLERMIVPFRRQRIPELGWVYSNLDEIDEAGNIVVRRALDGVVAEHPKRSLYECIAHDMFVLPSATLMSRRAFDAVGGFDERLSGFEDDDLFLRMFRKGFDNIYIPRPLSQWRIFGTSASFSPRMRRSRMIFFRKLVEACPNDPPRSRYPAMQYLAPRFFPWLVREYTEAIKLGDRAAITAACDDLAYAAALHNPRVRTLMNLALPVMRRPGLALRVMPLIGMIRPTVRRMLR
ncbi:MAG TPA: glycosyltransferase [Acetobacteraceae bacterium]|nr:glycosyltransferase [Acetobacteraceae bacterium]